MDIHISHIHPHSLVDGPGDRVVVFLQGCTLACPGCQNKALWDKNTGAFYDHTELGKTLATLAGNGTRGVTISGGEPFQQVQSVAYLVRDLRERGITDIVVYSGYTWEEINNTFSSMFVREVLKRISVLVDGRFVASKDHDRIQWRGSANQRPIDVRESLLAGEVVVLDWDTPRVIISDEGDIFIPAGAAVDWQTIGLPEATRRCGQTR